MREVLEQAILDNPDDPGPYGVLADWLSERGDPRGEFISVQLQLEDETRSPAERQRLQQREQELLEAHQQEWLGPLGPLVADNSLVRNVETNEEVLNYALRFERGFLRSLEAHFLYVPVARAIRDSAETRFLRELAIGYIETEHEEHVYTPGDDVPAWERDHIQFISIYPLLGRERFESLRKLRIGEEVDLDVFLFDEFGPSCHTYCRPLAELVERMPRLRELHLLCKDYDMQRLFSSQTLTELEVLRIYHYGVSRRREAPYAYPLKVLAKNPTFRNLTHLLFHPHQEEYHNDHYGQPRRPSFLPLEEVEAVLFSPHLRKLEHLQLRLSNMGDEGCRALADSGALERLRHLDLRHGCVTDAGAKILAKHLGTKKLERLDLCKNALSEKGVRLLQALGDFVDVESQMTPEEIAEEAYLTAGDSE